MNTPDKIKQGSTIKDKLKKITMGGALIGALMACDPGVKDGQIDQETFSPETSQVIDVDSDSLKFEEVKRTMKSEDEIRDIFSEYLSEEERAAVEKYQVRESVEAEYQHLKSLLGKTIYPIVIQEAPTDVVLYCSSLKEAKDLAQKYQKNSDGIVKVGEPFLFTEDKLAARIRDYIEVPVYCSMESRELWEQLFTYDD